MLSAPSHNASRSASRLVAATGARCCYPRFAERQGPRKEDEHGVFLEGEMGAKLFTLRHESVVALVLAALAWSDMAQSFSDSYGCGWELGVPELCSGREQRLKFLI